MVTTALLANQYERRLGFWRWSDLARVGGRYSDEWHQFTCLILAT